MILEGDHIKIRNGVYEHHGIYVGNNIVIHFSGVYPRKDGASIRYGTLEKFAGSAGIGAIDVVAYARSFAPGQVVVRAQSRLGQSGYDVFRNNCEAFARWCKTGEPVSQQVEVAKAAAGGVSGGAGATAAAVGVVSAAGAVAGVSGPGVMSGLASVGSVVGGGAAAGVGVLAAAPAVAANVAVGRAYRDDPNLPAEERSARKTARTAGIVAGVAGSIGTVGAVAAAGVPGLSAVGISTGLAAIGGSMVGGLAVAVAGPAVLVAGIAYVAYRIAKRK